jgi:hypothetical protein
MELYPEKNDFCELADWALNEKLFPKAQEMSANEIEELYKKVHHHFFSEMYRLLTRYYKKKIENPLE